ncbi:DrmE family protein [Parageobacillus thermoglucosidasius]|uniref:DrmE family protein n=1 Tax=Parageobacillus thermoglucosidasius TaxID=1426 RepID=UPI000B5779E6|nr:DrmE family protein [Parageobacillus thermoglucosidasius]MBY6268669.1 hypothetical protein [Parageobacillus thermoglucosidasius]OUM87656.1 MAG: hypothetical protein BAA00_19195 [Parageobacillus thermoglucosidasius]RDE28192.1 hypothetical protein DV714_07895 [Parageobacillus thermoglucosidasius]
MGSLSINQRLKALEAIMPNSLHINENYAECFRNMIATSESDWGRGMLNSEKFCLVESINTADSETMVSKVTTSNLDNFLLTLSLGAYYVSKKQSHSGDIIFSLPPFSYSFPLLLSYHLILNHLSSNLIEDKDKPKFDSNTGILIVSDNIELLSHTWRTSVNNVALRDFVPIFNYTGGKFKLFNFNSSKKNNSNFDGSLPWITFFRAFRKKLPEKLEYKPEVIILDLLPLLHRNRAKEIVEWAKTQSEHLIVIKSTNDLITNEIYDSFENKVSLNINSINMLKEIISIEDQTPINPITASWSIQSSLPFLLAVDKKIFNINRPNKIPNELGQLLNKFNNIFERAKCKNGEYPKSFLNVKNNLLKMLSICIPLEWYERTRWANGKTTLLENIKSAIKIQPVYEEEKMVYDLLMPHLKETVLSIYELYKKLKINPRGAAIIDVLKNNIHRYKKVQLIVLDTVDASELRVWLKSLRILKEENISKIEIITQREWIKSQTSEIYLSSKFPDLIVLSNPLLKKYMGGLYFNKETQIEMLDIYNETGLFKHQINNLYNNEKTLFDLSITLSNLFKDTFHVPDKFTESMPIADMIRIREFNISNYIKETKEVYTKMESSKIEISRLFDDEVLLNILENDEDVSIDSLRDEYSTNVIDTNDFYLRNEMNECIRLIVNSENSNKSIYLPIDMLFKVKKFNKDEVESISPYEIATNDILVKVKEQQRKELFNEILNLASNTLLMKWIKSNVAEWQNLIKQLWQMFYTPYQNKKNIYIKIRDSINSNGGKVESYLTIANWINGDVSLVRNIENMKAAGRVVENYEFVERAQTIYKAMKELWGIHIKLGKALGKLIEEYASAVSENKYQDEQWLNLGKDIVVSIEDLLSAIQIFKVIQVNKEKIIKVHPAFTEKPLDLGIEDKLKQKGMIIDDH